MQMQVKTIYVYDHHHHLSNRMCRALQCSWYLKCNGLNNWPVFGLFSADFTIIMKPFVQCESVSPSLVCVNIVLAGQLCGKYNGYSTIMLWVYA